MSAHKIVSLSPAKSSRAGRKVLQAGLVLACALVVLAIIIVFMVAGYYVSYKDKIHRGVWVRDLHLVGLSQAQAQAALADHFAALTATSWELRDGQRAWSVTLDQLGARFDAEATAQAAYAVGRTGSSSRNLGELISSLWQETQVAPVVLYDQVVARHYLLGLAEEINQPVLDATLSLEGWQAQATAPQVGRELDVEATLAVLNSLVGPLEERAVELVVVESSPRVLDAALARDQVRVITGAPLTLRIEETLTETLTETLPGPWQLSREDLAAILVLGEEPVGDDGSARITVTLNQDMLRAHLAPINQVVSRTATNARFIFNDDTRLLEVIDPGHDGRELDVEASLARINQQIATPEREVFLPLKAKLAEFNANVTGEELGITELVVAHTSYFAGSSEGRLNNVAVAASKFHGIIIKPGQEFSFNEWLGEVSEEEGYDESLIIYGNETIRDVGGGVCQVSTTAFGAAFWAGYPIVERWAHAYRVGYYEQGGLPIGMDATVYSPFVNFRFLNDTPYHLLIETYMYFAAPSLTFKFYSTKVGRVVELEGPVISDEIEHGEPVYREDAELAPGEVKQTEWATNGLTVELTRVIRDEATNEVVERKTFKSKFRPWDAVFLVGPGTEVPGHDVIRLDEEEGEGD